MIRYTLACERQHSFESWFQNSAAYDKQAKRGLVACPVCNSTKVEKAIMAPRLARTDVIEPPPPLPAPPPTQHRLRQPRHPSPSCRRRNASCAKSSKSCATPSPRTPTTSAQN